MRFTDHQQDIIRKINALRRVADRTEFFGQREAALAAIDRLCVRYQVNVEQLRDDVKRSRNIAAKPGWRRHLAIHLSYYLELCPTRARIFPGVFFIFATDAEFDLYRDTLEFHVRLVEGKEVELANALRALRAEIKERKATLRTESRARSRKMKWYLSGYISEVLPINMKKGKKVRLKWDEVAALHAGKAAGRAVQVNSCPRAISGSPS